MDQFVNTLEEKMRRYPKRVIFVSDQETVNQLKTLAERHDSSISWLIRMLIRAKFEEENAGLISNYQITMNGGVK